MGWEEHVDPQHQRKYWHNPSTGETTCGARASELRGAVVNKGSRAARHKGAVVNKGSRAARHKGAVVNKGSRAARHKGA
eukprot:gene4018-17616_t